MLLCVFMGRCGKGAVAATRLIPIALLRISSLCVIIFFNNFIPKKTVNRKSRCGTLSQRAGVGGSPVRVRCRSSPGSCKLKPARVVGDAGSFRRYKKGDIGYCPYPWE